MLKFIPNTNETGLSFVNYFKWKHSTKKVAIHNWSLFFISDSSATDVYADEFHF